MTTPRTKLFQPLPTERPPAEAEADVAAFWRRAQVFAKSLARTAGGPPYVFYEGPPTANGMPHHGHILTRVMKDLFPRYRTMCGFRVERKAGWDTHGLPVEIEVEKALGLSGKADVERYGVEPFARQCKESVWKYKREWEVLTDRIGFWLDMEHPYVTYTPDYVESVWWSLKTLHERGFLYKGHKVLPWCPRCATGLSSHEVGLGYLRVDDPAITVAFELLGQPEPVHALAWTTTPWTLLSNVALVVHPDVEYARARKDGNTYLLARARVEAVLGKGAEVLSVVRGRELVGTAYRPLFPFAEATGGSGGAAAVPPGADRPAQRVVADAYVTTTEGTGIVHAAPAFGVDDFRVCKDAGLAFVNLVQPDGHFTAACGDFAGRWVKDADPDIARDLRGRGLLLRQERVSHDYPHCWRCKTPLLYYARQAWFVETTRVRDRLVALNKGIRWFPEHIRDGRFGEFLADNKDWALSRERYWGTPLPVWECSATGCDGRVVAGSVAELRALNPAVPRDVDPHRPWIDAVTVPCPRCGAEARRVKEVIDCWYDSGAMPFAQWGYPHAEGSRERFERNFPAAFICEAIDQTRGWFYTLHALATLLFDRPAYEQCLVLGHVMTRVRVCEGCGAQYDASSAVTACTTCGKGRVELKVKKLSKRDRNYRPPAEVLDAHGADAFRWFFYSRMTPGQQVVWDDDGVKDARRTFLLKVLNVYKFFEEFASSDGFDPRPGGTPRPAVGAREPLDRWIVSWLHKTTGDVRDALEAYDFHAAAVALEAFVDGLSNWYLRRSRERGWSPASPGNASKWAFWWTLHEVLATLARLLAPFVPFVADDLHRVLERELGLPGAAESVHLTAYPAPDAALRDLPLEARMDLARRVVNLGLAVRTAARLKVRQPLGKAIALLASPGQEEDVAALADVVRDELNVKAVEVSREFDRFVTFDVRVDFRRLGPRFGKRLGAVRAALAKLDGRAAAASARAGQPVVLDVEGTPEALAPDELDVRLSAREGYAAAEEGGAVVVLETAVTPELLREGLAQEVKARVQAWRKELALPFEARIELWVVQSTAALSDAIAAHRSAIAADVLATAIHVGTSELRACEPGPDSVRRTEDVDGEVLGLALSVRR